MNVNENGFVSYIYLPLICCVILMLIFLLIILPIKKSIFRINMDQSTIDIKWKLSSSYINNIAIHMFNFSFASFTKPTLFSSRNWRKYFKIKAAVFDLFLIIDFIFTNKTVNEIYLDFLDCEFHQTEWIILEKTKRKIKITSNFYFKEGKWII